MVVLDRISLLSDSLLHRILSFLEIKSVVRTCVLSKRWKTLWTHIPTLNFDFDSYPFEPSTGIVPNARCSSITRFIFKVFSAHDCKSIKKLTYTSSIHADEAVLVAEALICIAETYQVHELCLNTFDTIYFDWPLDLLKCSSLTELKMTCGFVDEWEEFDLYFPCLRILEICYEWEDWVYDLVYKSRRELDCPHLESCVLINCICDSVSITAPELENFEFYVYSSKWKLCFPKFELLTPNLKSVKLGNVLPTVKSTSELSCVQEVDIAVHDSVFDEDGSATENSTQEFSKLLQVFHNARSFTLPLKAIEVLLSIPPSVAGLSFHNLRRLKLKSKANINTISLPISTLMNSLKCPNLEMLEVHLNQVELARTLAALQKKEEERENQRIEDTKWMKKETSLLNEKFKMVEESEQYKAIISQNRT